MFQRTALYKVLFLAKALKKALERKQATNSDDAKSTQFPHVCLQFFFLTQLSHVLPLPDRSEEDEKKIREDEEIKRRKEEDLRRRREEEIKRRREVVARVCKQPKVISATASEGEESHRGRAAASQSRKFLNLFGNSASQYSATGWYLYFYLFVTTFVCRVFFLQVAPHAALASPTQAFSFTSLHLPAASLLPPGGPHFEKPLPKRH